MNVATPENVAQQATAAAEPHARIGTSQVEPSSPPVVATSLPALPQNQVIRKSSAGVEAPADAVKPEQPVCAEVRQDAAGPPAEAAVPSDEVAALRHNGAGAPLTASGAGPGPDTLIEATPNYRNNPLPQYPFIARQRQWQGVVWLVVDVAANGSVDEVAVERSCGYRVLDRAARKTVQDWEFIPATRAGLPIESRVRIPVRFSLEKS